MSQVIRRADETEQGFVTTEIPDDRPVSQVVVETVAAVEGVEPTELPGQLYDSVDPDALDSLYDAASDDGGLRAVFSFAGYEVVVGTDGRVTVREDAGDASP